MSTTTKLYTIEDLMAMPTDQPRELWEGQLREVPGAGGVASQLAGFIFVLLWPFVRSRKGGMLTTADGSYILLNDPLTIVVPDVAFVRWERLPGGFQPSGYIPVPPDLAVEVRSLTDSRADIDDKLRRYRTAGVPLIWWVDPRHRTVTVYRKDVFIAELREGDVLDGDDILPGFTLPVSQIFE